MTQQPVQLRNGVAIMDPNNSTSAIPNTMAVNSDGSINVKSSSSGTFEASALANAAAPTWIEATVNPLSQDLSGNQRIIGNVGVLQSQTGLTSVVSASAESGHVLKGSAGTLWGLDVTTGATPGFVMIFNATSAPGDGAVTPIKCWQINANSSLGASWLSGPPLTFSTGITAVFSSTGPFTKTASATAFFSAEVA